MWHIAVREWELGRARAPNDIELLRGLGLAYALLGNMDRARLLLEHALHVAPDNAALRGDLAAIDESRGAA
jgi:Flp pilus assembly protein TadD